MPVRKIKTRRLPNARESVASGKPLVYSAGAAERYYANIRQLILRMSKITEEEILSLFRAEPAKEYFATDASVSSQARILINALQARFDDLFGFKAKGIADTVASDGNKTSAASLKLSLTDIAQGVTLSTDFLTTDLREVTTAAIAENVGLIKSIPSQYFTQIRGAVMRSITSGNGLQDLVPFLKKYEGVTLRRARIIAHDQTRKVFSDINRIRMQKLGIKKFKWLHSAGGQKPRKLHIKLSGQIFSWDDLPVADERTGERCGPGVLINCKCSAVPILDFGADEK